jgi:tetratricopeptide (TPR) repeat protein
MVRPLLLMPSPRLLRLAVALGLLCALPAGVNAADQYDSPAAAISSQARAECEAGRHAQTREDRKAHFERGQQLGEQAVTTDEQSAEAHFVLFCNMGELMRLDGESISSVFALRRLMAELDRAIMLDPHHSDALAAKGTLLVRLPRLLGGDAAKGEEMLRQVVQLDPNAFTTRLTLAKTCVARGDRDEAVVFASRALQIARSQGRADKIAEAQATLAELHAAR